jgi:hypothetical protein
LARNRLARQTKDSDGDYNALSATVSAAAQSAREPAGLELSRGSGERTVAEIGDR